MALPSIDIAAFVREPPTFVIDKGLVHIVQHYSNNFQVERVMLLSTFVRGIAAAQKAVRDYQARGHAEVVPFKAKGAH